MKNFVFISLLVLLAVINLSKAESQTAGNLSFTVTTTEPTGGYTNSNVIAIWIENNSGTFVKTKIKYAATRVQYLDQWITSSSQNVVDATTGPTRPSHGTLFVQWNGTDVNGNIVTDGSYKVRIQMSDANVNGPHATINFTKSNQNFNIYFGDTLNFKYMNVSWTPTDGIEETELKALNFYCNPNPFTSIASINYTLTELSDVTVTVHDINGKYIKTLIDENQNAGNHKYNWHVSNNDNIAPGVYIIKINTGKIITTRKVIYAG